jgi:hypothetical protein
VLEQSLISSEIGPSTVETSFKEVPVTGKFTFELPITVWFVAAIGGLAILGGLLRYLSSTTSGSWPVRVIGGLVAGCIGAVVAHLLLATFAPYRCAP